MNSHSQPPTTRFGRVGSFVTNVMVLSAFAAIAFWGHHTQWTMIPKSDDDATNSNVITAKTVKSDSSSSSETSSSPGAVVLDESAKDAGLEIAPARLERVQEQVLATAIVDYDPQRIAQLSTKAAGHVNEVFVKVGDEVKAGQVLALIDSQAVGEAKSDWLQKEATGHFRRLTLQRLQKAQSGALPGAKIKEAEAALKESELSTYMARQRLQNLGFDLSDVKIDFEAEPSQWSEQVRYLGIPTDLVEKLSQKSASSNLTVITAPFDSVVIEQHAVIGEVVSSDGHQFVVADTSKMSIHLAVRREDASKLKVGQKVAFMVDEQSAPIETELAWISPEIDEVTRTLRAGCLIDNPATSNTPKSQSSGKVSSNRLFRAKQFGEAMVNVADHEHAVVVPISALQRMPDQSTVVFVGDPLGQVFSARSVRVGLRQHSSAQILDGLQAGEPVVCKGSFVLKSEMMRASLVGG